MVLEVILEVIRADLVVIREDLEVIQEDLAVIREDLEVILEDQVDTMEGPAITLEDLVVFPEDQAVNMQVTKFLVVPMDTLQVLVAIREALGVIPQDPEIIRGDTLEVILPGPEVIQPVMEGFPPVILPDPGAIKPAQVAILEEEQDLILQGDTPKCQEDILRCPGVTSRPGCTPRGQRDITKVIIPRRGAFIRGPAVIHKVVQVDFLKGRQVKASIPATRNLISRAPPVKITNS